MRPGFQALLAAALAGTVDVVLAESLDRFSRDQENTAGLFKRLTFAGVRIVTTSEGDIGHLHIGLTGAMSALYLKSLGEKTHRGVRGRVEAGKSGGGLYFVPMHLRSRAHAPRNRSHPRSLMPSEAARTHVPPLNTCN